MAHITGGGLIDNIPRVLPEGCAVELDRKSWQVPPLFELLRSEGGIDDAEMARVFNMGLGMVIVAAPQHASLLKQSLRESIEVGRVTEQTGSGRVVFRG